jgi:hypothetical protein
MGRPAVEAAIEQAISTLLARRDAAATICPSEAARALAGTTADWRALMPAVRAVAQRLAVEGQLRLTQRGVALDPAAIPHGPIRLARGPRFDAGPA